MKIAFFVLLVTAASFVAAQPAAAECEPMPGSDVCDPIVEPRDVVDAARRVVDNVKRFLPDGPPECWYYPDSGQIRCELR